MLIGIASLAPQVGKTTILNYLNSKYNFTTTEMSNEIIIFCKKYLGYNGNKEDINQRKILQDVGLLWKNIHPNIWIYHNLAALYCRSIKNEYDCSFENYNNFVSLVNESGIDIIFSKIYINNIAIAGIRSSDEADCIKKLGGKVILIKRGTIEEGHPVERGLIDYNDFDYIINNEDSLEIFYEKIDKILEKEINNEKIL